MKGKVIVNEEMYHLRWGDQTRSGLASSKWLYAACQGIFGISSTLSILQPLILELSISHSLKELSLLNEVDDQTV